MPLTTLQNVEVAKIIPPLAIDIPKLQSQDYKELEASIKRLGVIIPVMLSRLANGRYEIVAGNYRCFAAKQVGLKRIMAEVGVFTSAEIRTQRLMESNKS